MMFATNSRINQGKKKSTCVGERDRNRQKQRESRQGKMLVICESA